MAKIQEWWDEPVQAAESEEWEDVNKKTVKSQKHNNSGRGGGRGRGSGGRSDGGGRGRGRDRSDRGGRGGDKRDRDRSDRPGRGPRGGGGRGSEKRQGPPPTKPDDAAPAATATESKPAAPAPPPPAPGVPVPSQNAPALKGAWGARAAAAAPPAPAPVAPPAAAPSKPVEKPAAPKTETSAPAPAAEKPTNGAASRPPVETKPSVPKTAVPPGGSVWAIKGSAHLIQAEKQPAPAPKPAPAAKPPKKTVTPEEPPKQQQAPPPEPPAPIPQSPGPKLESGLPKSVPPPPGVSTPSAWNQSVEPAPAAPIERPPPSPAVSSTISQPIASTDLPTSLDQAPSKVPESPAAMKVLNMGHWDSGDTDNIDFGFGSFGAAPITAPSPAAKPQSSLPPVASQTTATTSASPARPPPGLSISGMPPMPASAMTVADLENKLEGASLTQAPSAPKPVQPAPATTATQGGPPGVTPNPALPSALTQQNYGQYNMPGMYSYSNPGSGFVGMPTGPVLAGGVLPPLSHRNKTLGRQGYPLRINKVALLRLVNPRSLSKVFMVPRHHPPL